MTPDTDTAPIARGPARPRERPSDDHERFDSRRAQVDRLLADVDAPRKQRHTARRVWQRLIEEEGARVGESSVRAMVAGLKVEVGLDRRQVSVPQTHPPGAEAEVDFGEGCAAGTARADRGR